MTTYNPLPAPPSNLEDGSYAYYSLADAADDRGEDNGRRPLTKGWWILVSGLVALVTLLGLVACIVVVVPTRHSTETMATVREPPPLLPRGVAEGVSAKSRGGLRFGRSRLFAWTDRMLAWQRTGFHFQPLKNWMNDPNGPLYYKENYHFFYQYNPEGAVWGNIVWGHAISKDLINWEHLPIALSADEWYDINGVWTGSATILPDGQIIMLYTGYTNASVQVQNLAYPSDPSDSLLIHWSKYSGNPVLVPPPGINVHDFRDPTTAMLTTEGKWRINIGSKVNRTGISLLYDTADFKTYELLDGFLHAVQGTGMWECVDFYPVSVTENIGLDCSEQGSAVKHVLKASFDDDRNDYYTIGIYDEAGRKWVPDHGDLDLGFGWRYDYGKFYASKTFYDEKKARRVLWGWIPESDSENADISKGWASVQAIPRTILLDRKTGMNLLQWPVEEVEELRSKSWEVNNVVVEAGSVVPLDLGPSSQLDITAEFEIGKEAVESLISSHHDQKEKSYSCAGSGGAAERGALGPFGLLVVADKALSEQTPVYFYIVKSKDGNLTTHFCTDILRSSAAPDVDKTVYGSTVSVLDGEKLSVRILVDHSIIESFAQGGRTCITSRVYPTKAIYDDAKVFLFNNATKANVVASLKIWEMESADIHDSSSSPSLAIPSVNILGYMLPANLVLSFCILFSLVRYL